MTVQETLRWAKTTANYELYTGDGVNKWYVPKELARADATNSAQLKNSTVSVTVTVE